MSWEDWQAKCYIINTEYNRVSTLCGPISCEITLELAQEILAGPLEGMVALLLARPEKAKFYLAGKAARGMSEVGRNLVFAAAQSSRIDSICEAAINEAGYNHATYFHLQLLASAYSCAVDAIVGAEYAIGSFSHAAAMPIVYSLDFDIAFLKWAEEKLEAILSRRRASDGFGSGDAANARRNRGEGEIHGARDRIGVLYRNGGDGNVLNGPGFYWMARWDELRTQVAARSAANAAATAAAIAAAAAAAAAAVSAARVERTRLLWRTFWMARFIWRLRFKWRRSARRVRDPCLPRTRPYETICRDLTGT